MPDLAQPGQPPPPLFFPPFPNEEKMRRGRLNAEAPLGQLGETHAVAPGTPSLIAPPHMPAPATQSPAKEPLPQGVQPLARDPYKRPAYPQPLPAIDFGLDLNDDEDL